MWVRDGISIDDEEYTVAGATTAKEATKLIESGFQYVIAVEGIQLFRKRE